MTHALLGVGLDFGRWLRCRPAVRAGAARGANAAR